MCKIPFFDFEMDLSAECINSIKAHMEKTKGIVDKNSALDVLARNKHNGCGKNYDDFLSFWTHKPAFDVERLNEDGKRYFTMAKDFSYNFYNILKENGFYAWDIGESINLVRDCYLCGYLEKDLAYEIIDDFTHMAFEKYDNFEEYALSYIGGGAYFMFRNTGGNEEYAVQMFDKLSAAASDLFLNKNVNVWSKYKWYVPKPSPYFKNLNSIDTLIDSKLGCLVSNKISIDGCKIGYMYKEETSGEHPDSGWRFFADDEDDEYLADSDNVHVFQLNTICNYDKDIIPLLNSPIDTAYFRDETGEFAKEKLHDESLGKHYPINIEDYSKYIVVRNISEEYLLSHIKEYSEINTGEKRSYEFNYYTKKINENSSYIIIKCPDNMDFYNYHNLSEWFYGTKEDGNNIPELSAAICMSKIDNNNNYYAVLDDDNEYGDIIIGIFDNGTRFNIYLPEAFKENGNMIISYNKLHYTTVGEFLNNLGLNNEDLTCLKEKKYKTVTYEMAVS